MAGAGLPTFVDLSEVSGENLVDCLEVGTYLPTSRPLSSLLRCRLVPTWVSLRRVRSGERVSANEYIFNAEGDLTPRAASRRT